MAKTGLTGGWNSSSNLRASPVIPSLGPSGKTIYVVHQNIPAQFKHLAPALARDGHRVLFFTAGELPPPPGVVKVQYKPDASLGKEDHVNRMLDYASKTAKAMVEIKRNHGVTPDLIIGHASWGELLYLRDLFPKTPLIAYMEWFHDDKRLTRFDPSYETHADAPFVLRIRNITNYVTGDVCDAAVTPTHFQHSTYPRWIQQKMHVIHEGVDTTHIRRPPNPALKLPDGRLLQPHDEVVTWVTRNLEPLRGVKPIMRAISELCRRRPRTQVVVIGGDGVSYGNPLPEGETWKKRMLQEVEIDPERVHFLGQVSYNTFLGALYISSAHIYFTYPIFLSWSMLEAMAAECLVIGSDSAPVTEVIRDGFNGLICPFHDHMGLVDRISAVLDDPARFAPLRQEARRTILERYDLHGVCLPRQKALINSLL